MQTPPQSRRGSWRMICVENSQPSGKENKLLFDRKAVTALNLAAVIESIVHISYRCSLRPKYPSLVADADMTRTFYTDFAWRECLLLYLIDLATEHVFPTLFLLSSIQMFSSFLGVSYKCYRILQLIGHNHPPQGINFGDKIQSTGTISTTVCDCCFICYFCACL